MQVARLLHTDEANQMKRFPLIIISCYLFADTKMHRQVIPVGCNSPAPPGDWGRPDHERVAQGTG